MIDLRSLTLRYADATRPVLDGVDLTIGAGELVLLAELKHLDADHENVADHAAQVVMDKAGVALDRCLFLPKGALPKTPSGKIQRFQCRRLLEQRALEPVAQVVLAGG